MTYYQQSTKSTTSVSFIMNIISVLLISLGTVLPVHAVALHEYCENKATFMQEVFDSRDVVTKKEMMESIKTGWIETGKITPWFIVVDLQRMTNDIYRKNRSGEWRNKTSRSLINDEVYACHTYGF